MARKTIAEFEALLDTGYIMTKQDFADIMESVHPGYKVYTATLTQSSVSAPGATINKNQLGTITSAYDSVGNYHLTGTGLFTGSVCVIVGSAIGFINAVVTDINTISIETKDVSGADADGILTNTTIEIRVYD